MNKQFFAIIFVVVGILFGVFAVTRDKSAPESTSSGQLSNHREGAGKKGVTLIEYGDFQCPTCKSYFPLVQAVRTKYGDDITFQFHHFPLVQIHTQAFAAARAAEAAGEQGKFFQMHDLLYENQDSWSKLTNPTPAFESYAAQLSLNLEKFKTDMNSQKTSDIINADMASALKLGAQGTPTFVINGKLVENLPRNLDDFQKLIDQAIAEKSQ